MMSLPREKTNRKHYLSEAKSQIKSAILQRKLIILQRKVDYIAGGSLKLLFAKRPYCVGILSLNPD